MKEAHGNLWDLPGYNGKPFQARVITTNGFVKQNGACVMGRGCAKEARDKFPGVDIKLGTYIKQYGNRCFNLGTYSLTHPEDRPEPFTLVSMPVKHVWNEPADRRLISTSAWQLMEMADKFNWQSIILPRPGCGNGQLQWSNVRTSLTLLLDDRFTVVTF